MSRNAIYNALLAIGAAVVVDGVAWGESGRRLKTPDQSQLPALFQVEPQETHQSMAGLAAKRTFDVMWFIYHNTGADQSAVPTSYSADIIDAIETALSSVPGVRQDLGGQTFAAFIDGQIKKWEGDLDGITIMMIPIKVVAP